MTRDIETSRDAAADASASPCASSSHRSAPTFRSWAPWLLLIGVFVLEFFLFDHYGARRHTHVYPRWNDQVQYLGESYTAYERSRTSTFGAALEHTLVNPSAQGTLHDAAALVAFKIAGPSRSAALALNILALIGWQAALFFAVTRLGGSPAIAFATALLPLALVGPWENIPGSAYDFRLDHLAMCWIGITSALALASDGFRRRRASFYFGVAVAITLLTRFLTGTYFTLIFVASLAWTLSGTERVHRTANLVRAAVVAFVIAGPFFWLNRQQMVEYYWIGHYFGPESAIRDPHLGLGGSLRFVFGQLGERHVGWFFGALALLGTVGFVCSGTRKTPVTSAARTAWLVGAIFFLAPTIVLTLHRQKSEVVVSALVPGLVLLVAALWINVARSVTRPRVAAIASLLLTSAALVFFAQRQLRPAFDPAALAHIRQVNTIADLIHDRIAAAKLTRPRIGVDYVTDCLDAEVLRVICYERKRVWLPLDMTLPLGIAEPTEDAVMQRLAVTDFMFLTDEAGPGLYPFDRKLIAMRPQLRAWCEANLRACEHFELLGRRMTLYQRREIPFAPAQP
jgi:hypothetical protein